MSPRMMPKSTSGRSRRAEALDPADFERGGRDDVVPLVLEPPDTFLLDHDVLVAPEDDLGFAVAAEQRDEGRLVPGDTWLEDGDHLIEGVMAGELHAVGEERREVRLDGRAARMDPSRIPQDGILGEQVDEIPDLADPVDGRAVRGDER